MSINRHWEGPSSPLFETYEGEGRAHEEAHSMQQQTFAEVSFEPYRTSPRYEWFLHEMNHLAPWADLVAVIEQILPQG
jgi:hypothetical protein